jgi:hypothetical protein
MTMTISEKLINRLRREFPEFNENIPLSEKPHRLYCGYNQRSIGAWSWCIGASINCPASYGSQWNMKTLLKAKHLSMYIENLFETSILPEE